MYIYPVDMTTLQIDVRERDLIANIAAQIAANPLFKDMTYSVAALPVGDAIISAPDSRAYVIVERKCIADLFASIKDGRYEEQSYRLGGTDEWHNHNVMYVVEGATPADRGTFFSAMFSLNYYKGFSVMRTATIDETAFFLLNSIRRIERNNKEHKYPLYGCYATSPSHDVAAAPAPEQNYVAVTKKVKKDNVTPANIGEFMLCTIPGVSSTTAALIMNHYGGSIENLIKALREQGANALKSIKTPRKLNKTVVANIETFLLYTNNITTTL